MPVTSYMNAVQRNRTAFDRWREAEDALAEATKRCRQRPTLRNRIDEQLARDAAAEASRHYRLCDETAKAECAPHIEDVATFRVFDRLCYEGGSRGLWSRRSW